MTTAFQQERHMRTRRESSSTDRRDFLINGITLAGAAALTPAAAGESDAAASGAPVRIAQASPPPLAAVAPSGLIVKSVARLAGSATSFAYAVKAGPW